MLVHVRSLTIGYVGIMPVIPRPRATESHGFYVKKESFSTRTEAVRRERYFKTGRVRDELAVLNCRTVAAATGRGFKSRRPEILLCPGTQTFSLCAHRTACPLGAQAGRPVFRHAPKLRFFSARGSVRTSCSAQELSDCRT